MGWTNSFIWFLCLSVSECWQPLDSKSVIRGEVQSPQYPRPYLPNLLRKWDIWVPEGYQIQLSLKHLDIKASSGCYQDSLTVLYDQNVLGKFCGQDNSTDHPGKEPILSQGNKLSLVFQTSDFNSELQQHIGFSASYKAIVIACGEPEPLLNGGVIFLSGFLNQYRSVIQYHCNEPFYTLPGGENVTFTCEADRKWRTNHNNVTPTCIPVCGKPTKLISAYQRILGGSEAPDYTIPWQVLLNIDGGRGGGMVIGDRWIMTAATDLTRDGKPISNETLRMYMGPTDVKRLMGSPVYAASIYIHPEFNNTNGLDFNHDIALIKLQDPITFNSSVMPICLPAEGATFVTGEIGLVSGFGITNIYPLQLTNKLKYVQLPVVEQKTCSNSVNKLKKTRDNVPSLTNNMFCVGVPEGGKDSCLGDNGGPYALRDNGRFWAAGIVSWGVDCGKQGTYGVYTRVTNYMDWINKTMQEN
ncbi:complement C1r subcomponent-like [Etheostoma cragini]|uniref:complement C1r subcomponent-like n=1 Tax=Etheostoma cragini TaxID=417921 RepID=UPI00155EEC36|nr:complement C1r subcomponent-like [Etheostoma cragini]